MKKKKTELIKQIKNYLLKPKDKDQLSDILKSAFDKNMMDSDALMMLEGVLNVSEMHVRDIMIPRSQMDIIDISKKIEEFIPFVVKTSHSRFPVIEGSINNVIGILLAKDLLRFTSGEEFKVRDSLRPAIFVPESKRLNVLLKDFRTNRNHIAIVVDEYGGVAGMVTIEDVLEQIVGDIEDEYDFEEEGFINKHTNGSYTIKALTPIEDFNEQFETEFSDDEFDTIGGLVTNCFGHLPKRDEQVSVGGFNFKVLNADGRRVHLLQMTKSS